MNSIKNILRRTMKDLTAEQFSNFKYHLNDKGRIPRGDLETKTVYDTVELIVQVYTEEESSNIVLAILKEMNLNELAKNMQKELDIFHRPHSQVNGVWSQNSEMRRRCRAITLDSSETPSKQIRLDSIERIDRPFFTLLNEREKSRMEAFSNNQIWKSEQMKGMMATHISSVTDKIRALEDEIGAGNNQQEKRKAHLRMFTEEWHFLIRFKVIFDRSADIIETLQTEQEIKEEFEKLRQFLRDEEEARTLKEAEEQKHRKMKEMFENMRRERSSFPETL